MHAFFRLMEQSFADARAPGDGTSGTILFRVLGLAQESWVVELDSAACSVREGEVDSPGLTVFCDNKQLGAMMTQGLTDRPLRLEGDRRLLDRLAKIVGDGL